LIVLHHEQTIINARSFHQCLHCELHRVRVSCERCCGLRTVAWCFRRCRRTLCSVWCPVSTLYWSAVCLHSMCRRIWVVLWQLHCAMSHVAVSSRRRQVCLSVCLSHEHSLISYIMRVLVAQHGTVNCRSSNWCHVVFTPLCLCHQLIQFGTGVNTASCVCRT